MIPDAAWDHKNISLTELSLSFHEISTDSEWITATPANEADCTFLQNSTDIFHENFFTYITCQVGAEPCWSLCPRVLLLYISWSVDSCRWRLAERMWRTSTFTGEKRTLEFIFELHSCLYSLPIFNISNMSFRCSWFYETTIRYNKLDGSFPIFLTAGWSRMGNDLWKIVFYWLTSLMPN